MLQHPIRRGQESHPRTTAHVRRQIQNDGGHDADGGGRGGLEGAVQGSSAQSDAPRSRRRRHATRLRARLRLPARKVSTLTRAAFISTTYFQLGAFLDQDLSFSTPVRDELYHISKIFSH